MILAIVGSRDCGSLTLDTVIAHIPEETTSIISGGAYGADAFAKLAAYRLRLPYEEIRPDYKTHGKIAPILRNREIVERADMVIAFWNYRSNGTRNALLESLKLDKKIKIVIVR